MRNRETDEPDIGKQPEFCQSCQSEVFRNQRPGGVEIGNPRRPMCIPCYMNFRKGRESAWKKKTALRELKPPRKDCNKP